MSHCGLAVCLRLCPPQNTSAMIGIDARRPDEAGRRLKTYITEVNSHAALRPN